MPVESLNYGDIFKRVLEFRDINKIDINACTIDELMQIPEINELMAGRIVKYRERVGPVTKDALIQIGLEEREIRHLMKFVKVSKPENHETNMNRRGKKFALNENA